MTGHETPESDGAEGLAHELRDEASRLVHHPSDEMKRLSHVAADGESATTPLLVVLAVIGVVAVILFFMLGVALLAYYVM
jgi:CHASE3 domain sensor protein